MNKTKEDKGIKSKKEIKNKKNNSRIILISIVTIVLLVIIGISIYFTSNPLKFLSSNKAFELFFFFPSRRKYIINWLWKYE